MPVNRDGVPCGVKICGLADPDQALAIARLGATHLGFVCVPASPRYVSGDRIRAVADCLRAAVAAGDLAALPRCVGVFANADPDLVAKTAAIAGLTGVQLHGDESPDTCRRLRDRRPDLELWKAFRVRGPETLDRVADYAEVADAVLLDAYRPGQLGGTGAVLDWGAIAEFSPALPWWLAGGLTPENAAIALAQTAPAGIDLSSGVEHSPGVKDLDRVAQLFAVLEGTRPAF